MHYFTIMRRDSINEQAQKQESYQNRTSTSKDPIFFDSSTDPPPSYRSVSVQPTHSQKSVRNDLHLSGKTPDSRAILAVSPFGLSEGTNFGQSVVLKQLFKEAVSEHNSLLQMHDATDKKSGTENSDDQQLQSMINKYQSHVLLNQQQQQQRQQQQRQPKTRQDYIHVTNNDNTHTPVAAHLRFLLPSPLTTSLGPEHYSPSMSHSQPNLNNFESRRSIVNSSNANWHQRTSEHRQPWKCDSECDSSPQVRVTERIINLLSEENKTLKRQLDVSVKKTLKLQQLELGYQRIQREYKELMAHKNKQEQLEKQASVRMNAEMRRLGGENVQLQQQLSKLTDQLTKLRSTPDQGTDDEIRRLNAFVAHLLPQNRELLACKERQCVELQAQSVTLEEQRNHIQILEKALRNTQEKLLNKEDQCDQLSRVVIRNTELQKSLEDSIKIAEYWEEVRKRRIAQLEMDNAQLKMQLAKENVIMSANISCKKASSLPVNRSSLATEQIITRLKRDIGIKDARIINLQKQLLEFGFKCDDQKQWTVDKKVRHNSNIETNDPERIQFNTRIARLRRMDALSLEKDCDFKLTNLQPGANRRVSMDGEQHWDGDILDARQDPLALSDGRLQLVRLGLLSSAHIRPSKITHSLDGNFDRFRPAFLRQDLSAPTLRRFSPPNDRLFGPTTTCNMVGDKAASKSNDDEEQVWNV